MFIISVTHPTHPDFTVPGIVLALGEGDVGQLGLGEDIIERARPAHVKIDDKIVQVCAGGMHTVCLTNLGKVSYAKANLIRITCLLYRFVFFEEPAFFRTF